MFDVLSALIKTQGFVRVGNFEYLLLRKFTLKQIPQLMKSHKALLSLLAVCLLSITVTLLTQAYWQERYYRFQSKGNSSECSEHLVKNEVELTQRKCKSPAAQTQSITLFVRMAATLPELRRRFYCVFLRLSVLFWPASLGKTVAVLDQENEEDHAFASTVLTHMKQHFPDRTFEVLYEPLPKDPTVLDFANPPRSPGYNRQLYSSFFIDLYTNDDIIAWMDADSGFVSPVTNQTIFNGTKVRVLGYDCTLTIGWVQAWARTTEKALGLPFLADFMTYFPVYIYRDTFTHCREHILRRFNTSNFEEAFKKFYRQEFISPVSVVLSYAWYFERERYDWNLKLCTDLTEYNKRFPSEHIISPEHVVETLLIPQTAFHVQHAQGVRQFVFNSYCLSQEAAGNDAEKCSNRTASLITNFVLFNHDVQRLGHPAPPCPKNREETCVQLLERNYDQIGLEIKQKTRKLDWKNVEIVEKLAKELKLQCDVLK